MNEVNPAAQLEYCTCCDEYFPVDPGTGLPSCPCNSEEIAVENGDEYDWEDDYVLPLDFND